MLQHFFSPLQNQSGKAESKAPMAILILFVLGVAYWMYAYGTVYYNDYYFQKAVEDELKYDKFKSKKRPEPKEIKDKILTRARNLNITIDEKDPKQFLKVDKDGQLYKADVAYKVVVKHPVGSPHVMYFSHQLRVK